MGAKVNSDDTFCVTLGWYYLVTPTIRTLLT